MDVLAFLGSPRKKGNSETLLNAMLEGVHDAGGRSETIRLCDLNIAPCISCGGCDRTGECVVIDDMTPLYGKIIAAKRVILTSPIFFYGITAQAKAFVDRTQALWNRKRLAQEAGIWKEDPERRGFFLSVAATRGERVFEGAVLCMKYAYDAMDMRYDGELLVRGIDARGEMKEDAAHLAAAREAGRNLILTRRTHFE